MRQSAVPAQNIMKKTIILLLLVVMAVYTAHIKAEEVKVLKKINLYAMARGAQIKFIRIMANGEVWFLTTAIGGKDIRLIRKNLFTRKLRSFYIPLKEVDFVATSPNCKYAVVYNKHGKEFWHIDVEKEKSTLLSRQESQPRGFALYGAKRSFLKYFQNSLYGWGFEYLKTKKTKYLADTLVKFEIVALGKKPVSFRRIIERGDLVKIAKKHFAKAKGIGRLLASDDYLTFAALAPKHGKLIGVNTQSKNNFVIDEFRYLMRSAIAPNGKYFAYVKNTNTLNNAVYIYSFAKRKSQKLFVGRITDIIFNRQGDKLALALIDVKRPKKRGQRPRLVFGRIVIVDLKTKQQKQYPLLKNNFYPYWAFTGDDKHLIFFSPQSEFYKLDLQIKKVGPK